jgi:acetyltransferase-like isoleucine patch superfamily enzyme
MMAHLKAKKRGLDRLRWLRYIFVSARFWVLHRVFGMDIHPSCQISLSAKLDLTYPVGVHVGENTYLAFESRILCHDRTRGLHLHTRIGKNCFVGGRSLILPGVEVGDGCIIGAGAIVTKSVPAGCIVAGNPAIVIRENIVVGPYGRLPDADEREHEIVSRGEV